MDVVFYAANFEGLHAVLSRDAAQERPEPLPERRREQRSALFGAEYAMVIRTHVGHA